MGEMESRSFLLFMTFTLTLIMTSLHTASTQDDETTMSKQDAWSFLEKYGYLPKSDSNDQVNADDVFRKMLLDMQYMAGINQTGELDNATITMMQTPRCSVSDTLGFGDSAKRRRKRYAIQGSKWRSNSVTYGLSKLTQQFSPDAQKQILSNALQYWADASSLTFQESSNPDIDIRFVTRDHGDGNPFDGRGGVLAHAYFPGSGGDAHFDNDEQWTDQSYQGTNLKQVAIHEFGHSLGLAHSNDMQAIMYAYYLGYQPNPQLNRDDIAGIQYIYGPPAKTNLPGIRTTFKSQTTAAPVVTRGFITTQSFMKPSICSNPVVDAIICIDGVTYAFSGTDYYILNDVGIQAGYPRKISSNWPEINGKVDAAIDYPAVTSVDKYGRTVVIKPAYLFLFQGSIYWKYTSINKLESGYPRTIKDGFPGLPDNIDTGFTWSGNGRIYFIKGANYYRYSPSVGTDAGYPRPLSGWTGVPSSVSAAFQWKNGMTYFFSGQNYWRFDDANFAVATGYPRNTGEWWFGCSNSLSSGDVKYEEPNNQNQFLEINNNSSAPSVLSSLNILVICLSILLIKINI